MLIVAWVQGNPYDQQLVNWVSERLFTKPGKTPSFEKSKDLLEKIRTLFKDKPKEHPLFQKILDGDIESGKYMISTVLDEYKATPLILPGLNHLQARLIISPEYLGNPSMDVKVFTYDRIPNNKKQTYEKALDDIVEKIFKDILARARQLTDDPLSGNQTEPTPSSPEAQDLQTKIETFESQLTTLQNDTSAQISQEIISVAQKYSSSLRKNFNNLGSLDKNQLTLTRSHLENITNIITELEKRVTP